MFNIPPCERVRRMKWDHQKTGDLNRYVSAKGDVFIEFDPINGEWVVYTFANGEVERRSAFRRSSDAKACGQQFTQAGAYLLTIDPTIEPKQVHRRRRKRG